MKVVGFGDFLIHFSPTENRRFVQSDLMRMSFTGAEANVCAALAYWGEEVQFVTKLPRHALARKGLMFLQSLGVKTDYVAHGDGRMGIYFLESGYSVRSSSVIYDRQNTLFTDCCFDDYNWNEILKDADAVYLSGITPSLSEALRQCCERTLAEAQKRRIPVFFDLNLRPTLCDIHRSREIFQSLAPYITHLIGNEEHLRQLLQIDIPATEDPYRLRDFTKAVQKKAGIDHVAVTVRRTPCANKAIIYASYCDGEHFAVTSPKELDVADRVGSGDAFSAGIVFSVLHKRDVQSAVDFAIASGALKHTIPDDINFSTLEEVESIVSSRPYDVRR